jgi:amino-acid N-acetyltransferase
MSSELPQTEPQTEPHTDFHTDPSVKRQAITVRRARTSDVASVRALLDGYVSEGILLDKATVTLYEDIQEFWVAERDEDATVIGCGALHVMWEDLA